MKAFDMIGELAATAVSVLFVVLMLTRFPWLLVGFAVFGVSVIASNGAKSLNKALNKTAQSQD